MDEELAAANHAHDGLWCICRGDVLLCIDLERPELRFETRCELDNHPPPKDLPFICVSGQRIWIGHDRVAVLCNNDPFLTLRLFDAARGDLLREIPIRERPDGKPWPHIEGGFDFIPHASVEPRSDLLAVSVLDSPYIASEDYANSAHIWRIDPQTGDVMWATSFEHDPWPGFISGTVTVSGAGIVLARTDWQSGEILVSDEPDKIWGYCDNRDGLIYAPYWKRGRVGLRIIDEHTGDTRSDKEWRHTGVRGLSVLTGPSAVAVNTNAQGLSLIGPDGLPAWTTNAPPYPYAIASDTDGPIFVGTSGQGGYLLALNRATGAELLRIKPKTGGVSRVHPWRGLALGAPDIGGLILVERESLRHTLLPTGSLINSTAEHLICSSRQTEGDLVLHFFDTN
jgi:hypothetical protein